MSWNGALLEGHDILSERAGFIGEDVLDLTQLLVQGGGSGFGWRVLLSVIHLQIPVNELTLTQTDHLHAEGQEENKNEWMIWQSVCSATVVCGCSSIDIVPHIKRDGHHGVEDDDVAPETEEASVRWRLVLAVGKIPGLRADALVPVRVSDGQTSTQQHQQRKDLPGRKRVMKILMIMDLPYNISL